MAEETAIPYCGRIVEPKKLQLDFVKLTDLPEISYTDLLVPTEELLASLQTTLATNGYSHGYSWKYSNPVVDTMTQAINLKIVAYGLGDDSHWNGCGDHVSKPCSGHTGWITAVDLMSGPNFTATDFFHNFLVPAVAVEFTGGSVFYPELKYAICDYELRDRRIDYKWRKQSGGDGPDHCHLSFTNAFSAHTRILLEYEAWLADGRKPVVAWLTAYRSGGTIDTRKKDSAVATTVVGGKTHTFVIGNDNGTNGWLYYSPNLGGTFGRILAVGNKWKGPWDSYGVGVCSPNNDDLLVSTVTTDGRIYLHYFKTAEPYSSVADATKYVQYGPLGTNGSARAGGRVELASLGDGNVLMSCRGTNGHFYTQILNPKTGVLGPITEPNSASRVA